ncbi:MAG: recombinase family protein [Gemmatimonadota bacterium]|nr:MAG: recombinase family protein [Gemmatimonadota bacterium]
MSHAKIQRTHLARRAVVYLRQSTMKQVHEHRESTQRQYALSHRAEQLGWPSHAVEVVDEDLGQSGASAQWREGFQRLAQQVSQGRVGAIFALEVSRLARSSADWHHLLDLCGWTDVVIADEQAVFAPNDPNDRLLLGLKGQMSEAEKYWMRLRLQGAQRSKARRGELRLNAPTGYVWDRAAQRLQLDPDEEVRRTVRLIFERFRIDGSAGRVAAYFVEHGLVLATRDSNGDVVRKRPLRSTVLCILHNPFYAGAYVYGRREYRTALVDGELRRGQVTRLPIEAWKVHIADRHAAYISWEEFVANQDKLEGNCNRRRAADRHGAAREGEALLQGLVLCGRCGHRMTVQQGGKQAARYVCKALVDGGVSTKACWSVSAGAIDSTVAHYFLQAAQPPEVELSLAVTREVERQAGELEQLWKSRLERARYEAQLAERRYKAVDPDNRVVARTLEGDWEAKLRELEELEEAYRSAQRTQQVELSDADRAEVLSLARNLPRVWKAATTTNVQRKNLLRLLVQEVALAPVDVPRRMTRIQILWHTGAVTEVAVERPRHRPGTQASEAAVEHIRTRVGEGWRDCDIAEDLNRLGIVSGKGREWTTQMVTGVRKRRRIRSQNAPPRQGGWPAKRSDGLLSVRGVAEHFGVSRRMVRTWIESGRLTPAAGGGRGRPLWFVLDADAERRLAGAVQKGRSARMSN